MHGHVGHYWQRRRRVCCPFLPSHINELSHRLLADIRINSIDLTPANCVHLLEPHWSPMVEAQAVDRVHRIGQSRPVQATRYVTRESVEIVSLRPPFSVSILLAIADREIVRAMGSKSEATTHQSVFGSGNGRGDANGHR